MRYIKFTREVKQILLKITAFRRRQANHQEIFFTILKTKANLQKSKEGKPLYKHGHGHDRRHQTGGRCDTAIGVKPQEE